jgi:hypothetical protein
VRPRHFHFLFASATPTPKILRSDPPHIPTQIHYEIDRYVSIAKGEAKGLSHLAGRIILALIRDAL